MTSILVLISAPSKVGDLGDRILYTRNYQAYNIKNSALARLYLDGYLYIGSSSEGLADSYAGGRIVVVSGKTTR